MSEETKNTVETKITVDYTTPIKSTTSVQGILTECSNGQYYVITKMMPKRNPWFIRCVPSTSAGKTNVANIKDEVFSLSMGSKGEPDFEIGIALLEEILNGAEAPKDKMNFYF